jgi:hypothetical protein
MKRWKRSSRTERTTDVPSRPRTTSDTKIVLGIAAALGVVLAAVAAWDSSSGSFSKSLSLAALSIDPRSGVAPAKDPDPGRIVVAGVPAGFFVRVDGVAYPRGDEADVIIPAGPGTHRVEIVNKDGESWVTRVAVPRRGAVTTSSGLSGEIVIERKPGDPLTGQVYLDGRPVDGLPAFVDSAVVGDHTVEVRSDSALLWKSEFTVRNGSVTRIEIP